MFMFFRALMERFHAKQVADAGLDFEANLIARDAERKAVLLRRADRYDDEGLHHVANELRQRAEAISFQRPLAILLVAKEQLGQDKPPKPSPALTVTPTIPASNGAHNRLTDPKKRK